MNQKRDGADETWNWKIDLAADVPVPGKVHVHSKRGANLRSEGQQVVASQNEDNLEYWTIVSAGQANQFHFGRQTMCVDGL